MQSFVRTVAFVALLSVAGAHAQQAEPDGDRAEKARTFAESVIAELALTDAQEEQVRGILESSAENREALMSRAEAIRGGGGSRRSKFREMKSLRKDMQAQQASTRDALADVLDDEQMETFDALMAERRAEIEAQVRARRSG